MAHRALPLPSIPLDLTFRHLSPTFCDPFLCLCIFTRWPGHRGGEQVGQAVGALEPWGVLLEGVCFSRWAGGDLFLWRVWLLSWKCQEVLEPHKGTERTVCGKGQHLLPCPRRLSCRQRFSKWGPQTAYDISQLHGPAHPSWEKPSHRTGSGKETWRRMKSLLSSFYVQVLTRRHALCFCRLYQQHIPEMNSSTSSWLHCTRAFPAANNFASSWWGL